MLMPSSLCLPPVVYSPGTNPNQAANPRPLFKCCSAADCRDEGSRCDRSDAGDRNQPPAGFILAGRLLDHCVGFVDLPLQLVHLHLQLRQQYPQCAR